MVVAGIGLLSSCAIAPDKHVEVEDRQVMSDSVETPTGSAQVEQDNATPLDDRSYHIERADYYRRLSDSPGAEAIDAALSAAEFYIQANDIQGAYSSVAKIGSDSINEQQLARYEIVLAYLEYARREYRVALMRLQTLLSRIDIQGGDYNVQKVDALLLSSFCYQKLGDYDLAVNALVIREALLTGTAKAETSRYIWQVINGLSIEQRHGVIQDSINSVVRNRFEQSLYGQVGDAAPMPGQFEQWRSPSLTSSGDILDGQWSQNAPDTVAVLLPLSSRFSKAAQAVVDGIQYQHSLNTSIYKPRVNVYDIGSDPALVPQYYAAAQQNGAELIIGPLGKDYANRLTHLGAGAQSLPTILLGGDTILSRGVYRLTLSPERQGKIVADRALASGYVNAAILVPDDANGSRTAEAFSRHWLRSGGKLSKTITFSPRQFDHTTELKQLFDIKQSEYRHNAMSKLLGYKPDFAAYRRNDIDFVFLIADNNTGRIVRPQINFFSGTKMPVLSTTSIFNGIQDPTNNVDLDQTSFPVMPWVLVSNDVAPYAGQLNMLFALGSDAYSLAAQLQHMRSDPGLKLNGNMGILNIEASGEVGYRPIWANFKNGMAETDVELEYLLRPGLDPENYQHGDNEGPDGQGNYNESNWDHRQSRRKSGS